MTQAIGRSGLANTSAGDAETVKLVFTENASATKIGKLNPNVAYKVFGSTSGDSDVSVATTMDSYSAIKGGYAVWTPGRTFATMTGQANEYLGAIPKGTTAIKVTHAKNGAGADNAGKTTALGGRCLIRVVPGGEGTDEAGLTDYAPRAAAA